MSQERVSVGEEGAGVSLPGAVTTIIFVATKVLSQQSHFPDKHRTKVWLSRQTFCRNKHTIVATKDMFCRDERVFVATKVCLSRQNYVCYHIFATHICRDKIMFVATNAYLCRDKNGTCGSFCQWCDTVPNLTFDFMTSHHLPHEYSSEWSTDNQKQHHLSRKTEVTEKGHGVQNQILFFKEKRKSKQKVWKTFFF